MILSQKLNWQGLQIWILEAVCLDSNAGSFPTECDPREIT